MSTKLEPNMKRVFGHDETLLQMIYDKTGSDYLVGIAKCKGKCDIQRLKNAILKVQKQQPHLRAFIEKSDNKYYFNVDEIPKFYPVRFIEVDHKFDWESFVEEELQRKIRHSYYQWKLFVFMDLENGLFYLIFFCSHSLGDAHAIAYLFSNIFNIYRDGNIKLDAFPLFPSVEELSNKALKKKMSTQVSECNDEEETHWFYDQTVPLDKRITKGIYFCLNEDLITQLLTSCKEKKLKFNSLLNAAYLLAVCKVVDRDITVSIKTPINLRTKTLQQVPTDYFSYLTTLRIMKFAVSSKMSLWDLAEVYQNKLQEYLDNLIYTPVKIESDINRFDISIHDGTGDQFAAGLLLSNLGKLNFSTDYTDFKWEEFYFRLSRQSGDFAYSLFCSTLNNKLMGAISYCQPLLSCQKAKKIHQHFVDSLKNIINSK